MRVGRRKGPGLGTAGGGQGKGLLPPALPSKEEILEYNLH